MSYTEKFFKRGENIEFKQHSELRIVSLGSGFETRSLKKFHYGIKRANFTKLKSVKKSFERMDS